MKNIFNLFTPSTKENFPLNECTNQTNEKGVYESNTWYICLLFNKRFPEDGFLIKRLRPYIWTDGKEKFYAWIAANKGEFYDNYENPVHDDDTVIIGYICDSNQNNDWYTNNNKIVKDYLYKEVK